MLKKLFTIPFCFIVINTFSQTSIITPLSIGDKVPDVLFENIKYHKSSTAKLLDLKGKLVILDFWSTYCSTCMASFPKMEKLQNQYDGKLEIILVNSLEDEQTINERLTQLNKKRAAEGVKLIRLPKLAALNGDSTLRKLFPYQSIPHHVWISGEGKILAITKGSYANSENVEQVLEGKKVKFYYKDDFIDYNMKRDGLLKPVLSSFKPALYSCIMAYDPTVNVSSGASGILKDSANGTVRMYRPNNSIFNLYQGAFTISGSESEYRRILFEVKNWGIYKTPGIDDLTDKWLEKNLFSYELCVPEKYEDKMRIFMQDDLNRFFGGLYGIEGKLEKRKIKSLVLIQTKAGLLKNRGGKEKYERINDIKHFINYKFRYFSNALVEALEDMTKPIAFIDETGFTGLVDIEFKGDMRNLQNARQQLQQYGLDIIETEREIEVMVIKDKK